jgi:hypothetical protein
MENFPTPKLGRDEIVYMEDEGLGTRHPPQEWLNK